MEELSKFLNELLETKFSGNKHKFMLHFNSKSVKELKDRVIEKTAFLLDPIFSQRIYHILNNTDIVPTCYCGNSVRYTTLYKGYNEYCSQKCKNGSTKMRDKRKQTFLDRFGTTSPGKNQDIKNKVKQTNLKKYGYESHNSSDVVKENKKKVMLEKYGVENPSNVKEFNDKRKQTFLDRFGVENPNMNEDVKRRKKEYFLEKFGEICPAKNEIIKQKIKERLNSDETKNKAKQTNLERYGVEFVNQNSIIKKQINDNNFYNFINSGILLEKNVTPLFGKDDYSGVYKEYKFLCNVCKNEFLSHLRSCYDILRCPICNPINSGISNIEKQVVKWLESLNINIIENKRSIINPYELDIYLPDYNIAIEVNGMYWHSESNGKDKNYHLYKTDICLEKNIQLIHIFEDEWIFKQDIVKSIILSKLGICDKIYARKTIFKEVNTIDGNNFLDNNHLQGNSNSIQNYFGLYYNDELVQLIGIGRSRYNKNYDYELIRSCTKLNTVVIGGFDKLIKNLPLQGKLISYVDRRYFTGNGYKNWTYIGKTDPNYYYLSNGDYLNKQSRLKFQKHKLSKLFPDVYDIDLTEWEIMQLAGYDRIWDCGNLVYSISL